MSHQSQDAEQFLLAAKRAEIRALRELAASCELVTAVSELIHQLQRERGISNIFLASDGQRFAQQRGEQIGLAQSSEMQLRQLLHDRYLGAVHSAGMRLLNCISFSVQGLDNLAELRDQVDRLAISPLESTRAYSRLIAGLLSVVFEAADVADDPAVTRILVALFNFMQAKEYAGQERAWGAMGFAGSHFDAALNERLSHLVEGQRCNLDVFLEFAGDDERSRWQAVEDSQSVGDLNRLRELIQRLGEGEPITSELSEVWYDLATDRIDCMHGLEDSMATRLLAVSGARVADAEAELKDHRARLQALKAATEPAASPLTMLFDPEVPGLYGAGQRNAAGLPPAQSLTPNLARSIYDLIRGQVAHIKRMSDELNDARRALTERKQIERAKGILMRNLGLCEEKAYKKMQRRAMEMNVRLAEVAVRIIDIGDRKQIPAQQPEHAEA
ncbi:nitrate regulatory protein [Microbulbifer hainanensis]|uniref:nitrate regulatory protein n=1 Tax=Microbulbifer hainanensis TaxID=2735675 RepID=UPI001867518F|nr:nitrate regulatory protein [Microbulbifer hainanensis]